MAARARMRVSAIGQNGMTTAFTSDDCDVLARALSAAWDMFVRSGRLHAYNLDTAKAALARAVLDAFEAGERNVRHLAVRAVANMAAFEAQVIRHRPPIAEEDRARARKH